MVKFADSKAFHQGISFGVVSSAMTVLGVSLGMWASGGRIEVLIASIIGLSISNSMADAFSIYMANTATKDGAIAVQSALVTLCIEFLLPFIFVLPVLFLKLGQAILVNIIIGVVLVAYMGYYVSTLNNLDKDATVKRIVEYTGVLAVILICTMLSGKFTSTIQPALKRINAKFTAMY